MFRRNTTDMERRSMKLVHCLALAAAAILASPLPACAAGPDRASKPAARQQAAPALAASIQAAVAASGLDLKKVTVGISVREVGTGALVADIGGSTLMVPASNMKVLTTAAALRVLGPDFVYRTRLIRNGDRLTVVGDGDPSLGDPGMADNLGKPVAVDSLVDLWVNAAKDAGITQIRELVVDDRIFDRQFTHPGWPADQLSNSYCAEISGLEFNVNLLQARVGTSGGRPSVTAWTPAAPWLEVENKAGANAKNKQSVWIGRTEDPWKFTLNGNVKQAPAEPIAVCVHDMPTFFARYAGERMAAGGIKVGSTRIATDADAAAAGTPVGLPLTRALPDVVRQCNTESQNLYAESLLKRMGAKRSGKSGTWENGAAALAAEVDAALGAGTAAKWLIAKDGSGLCKENRVAPNLVSAWLRAIAIDPKVGPAFIGSLAVAGKTGTVAKRFKDLDTSRVFVPCKTGYINGVSCLSGFVGAPGQTPRFAFSILCNDLSKDKNGVSDAKALQEKIVSILAGGL
jgi:D-alanyl-D-alanine carboxypeptidase/D-alanyl-D-alanine-endopeptidase (penicillin-binding protein 4)